MKRWILAGLGSAALALAACGEPVNKQAGQSDGTEAGGDISVQHQTLEQADKAWFAAGAEGRGEIVGPGGEPEAVTARYVNGGRGVAYSAVGKNGWLVGSTEGWLQLVDAEGKPVGAERQALEGRGEVRFVAPPKKEKWLVGGEKGLVQLIDRDGQPTATLTTAFPNGTATAAAAGPSNWLIGSSNGALLRVSLDKLNDVGSPSSFPSGDAVRGIVRTGDVWVAVTETAAVKVTAAGANNPVVVASGRKVTAIAASGKTVALGSDDGYVATLDAAKDLAAPNWQKAWEGGHAVSKILKHDTSDEWLAVGEGGAARRLGANGAPVGQAATLGDGKVLTTARPLGDGWMVAVGDLSAVQEVDAKLEPARQDGDLLGGSQILGIASGENKFVIAGESGKYRILKSDGTPDGEVQTVSGVDTFHAVGFNGSSFLLGGSGGNVRLLSPDGNLGDPMSYLEGEDVAAISWSGTFWLIVGAEGTYHRLRRDATPYKMAANLELDGVSDAEFNGDQWMVVGQKEGNGAFSILDTKASVTQSATTVSRVSGSYHAVEWNGREWLTGGDGGIVTRIDQSGQVISEEGEEGGRNVLYGMPIYSISFNADIYLVGGANGAIRRLQFDTLPIRPAVAVNGFSEVRAMAWSRARGFPGGPCVSKDFCISGYCVGGVSLEGFCCDKQCDGPCESCYESVTGQPDGQCHPVAEGEEPPMRKQNAGEDCVEGSKENCGRTGTCDGNGKCAFWGPETVCKASSCSEGEETAEATCDGMGTCMVPEATSCEPFGGCTEDGKQCLASCDSDEDCVAGYVCGEDSTCVERGEENGDGEDGDGDGNGGDDKTKEEDKGCSATGSGQPLDLAPLAVLLLGGLVSRRVRRRRG